jgi:hypothetical protein
VKITPDERHVILTEFCLVARHAPPPYHPDIFADEAAWTPYQMGGLHDSQLYLLEMSSGDSRAIFPRGKTPGHLEFSRSRDGAFYLSCHSLSKAHGRVILHGPGKLLQYELRGHELAETGSYEQPDSWRLTSHVVSSYGGQNFVAVTVFPNRLAIFSDDSFELVREVELFPMGAIPTNGLHFSQLGRRIPIWLTTSSCERFLILVSNAYVYLYDMETGRTSEYANYTVADEMIGTAHIANISPLAQTL